jgi:hypothetical protein
VKLFSVMSPSNTEFDQTVHKILQRSEYAHLKSALSDFIRRIKEGISEWLLKILKKTFSNLKNPSQVSDKLSTIFIIIGLLVIIGIIIIIVIKVSKTFEKKARLKEILGERIDDKTTPYSLRQSAITFAQKGDFRQAIRYDFIALLFLMHGRNLIYLHETKTNQEIYNYLKKNNFFMLKEFHNMINTFNDFWYGHKLCSVETYKHWQESVNLMWDEVISYEEKNR